MKYVRDRAFLFRQLQLHFQNSSRRGRDTDERYGRDHTQAQELSIITCVKSTVFVWNLCEWLFPRWRYEFLFRWQAACSRR